jgi:tetratricopeptide (TPR) repeat protein
MSDSISVDELSTELYQQGRAQMELNKYESAAALFQRSIALRPNFKTLELLGECLLETDSKASEAVVALAAAVGLGNKAFRALLLLAKALAVTGRTKDAIEKLDLAIEINPNFKAATLLRTELSRGKSDESRR